MTATDPARKSTIRITPGDAAALAEIMIALEADDDDKSENVVLGALRDHFKLKGKPKSWPNRLVARGVALDDVINVLMDALSPFVEMVLSIYRFLGEHVSTTGGRTAHFRIEQGDALRRLEFPNVKFPREVKWIQAWETRAVTAAEVDWKAVRELLIVDNGIFYGRVDDIRVLQSLLVARRDGYLDEASRTVAQTIIVRLQSAVAAYERSRRDDAFDDDAEIDAYVPAVYRLLDESGSPGHRAREHWVSLRLNRLLDRSARTFSTRVMVRVADATPSPATGVEEPHAYAAAGAALVCALWKLDDTSFAEVVGVLRVHETQSMLSADDFRDRGAALLQRLLDRTTAAIVVQDTDETRRERVLKKMETLLLPFWKHRNFLYEVWVLIAVLEAAARAGARVVLEGVRPIDDPGVEGTTWNLPSQKAARAVSRLQGPQAQRELLVWFQRETRRVDRPKNMEPDVRVTSPWAPFADLLIVECKDRKAFGGGKALRLAHDYLAGSFAQDVWVVNYMNPGGRDEQVSTETDVNGRLAGAVLRFAPGTVAASATDRWRALVVREFAVQPPAPDGVRERVMVLDASGSMGRHRLPSLPLMRDLLAKDGANLFRWSEQVTGVSPDDCRDLRAASQLRCHGEETPQALADFVATLSAGTVVTVITDDDGRLAIEAHLTHEPSAGGSALAQRFAGHAIEIVVVS